MFTFLSEHELDRLLWIKNTAKYFKNLRKGSYFLL
jgi:hypothetical protein